MASADKLTELLRLLAARVPLEEARKRAGISDRAYTSILKDAIKRKRIEAAQRGVLSPDAGEPRTEPDVDPMARLAVGFYEFLTLPMWCALELSPAVRAIALASEGRADEICDDELCKRLFGCSSDYLPRKPPRVVVLRSGGQCGKTSRLGAPKVLHGALTVPLPNVLPGQQARALITAPDVDLATAAINYCRGFVFGSAAIRSMLTDSLSEDADEDDVGTAYRIGLKRPDDRLVELRIKAANRGGTGGRSRSLTGALLDEVCFFLGSDYRVNDAETFGAIEQRVVPGGQTWLTSSPNIADYGLLEELVAAEWGKHETALVALASTRLMFPGWDPTYEIEEPLRKRDPDKARREIDGLPLDAHETSFYSPAVIKAAEQRTAPRREPIARGAGGDFAFVRNSSALALAEAYGDGTFAVVDIQEHKPRQGHALRPSLVCASFARSMHRAETFAVVCDSHCRESVREHFAKQRAVCPSCGMLIEAPRARVGEWTCEVDARDSEDLGDGCGAVWTPTNARTIGVISGPEGVRAADPFKALRDGLNENRVKLIQHPRLAAQLRAVEGKPRPGPGQDYAIRQPEQRNAGPGGTAAHGDLVSAVVLALWRVGLGREQPTRRRSAFGTMAERVTP